MLIKLLLRLKHQEHAGVAIYVALLIGILILVLTFAMNYGQTSYYKNFAQNSLDAALLGAVSNLGNSQNNADLAKIAEEANEIFLSNIADKRGAASYSNIQVTKEPDGSYSATMVVTPVPGAGTGYIQDKFTAPMTLTSKVSFGAEGRPTEVSIALDTSLSMSGGKLTSAKSAVNTLINQVYGNKAIIDTMKISIIPFSDAVKIEPKATSNRWHVKPISDINFFSGCMVTRDNANAYTDEAPTSNQTKFPRYIGPFDIADKINISAYRVDGSKQPVLRYHVDETANGLTITLDDMVVCGGNSGPCSFGGNGGNGSRFNPELDYAHNIDGLTGSEKFVIDYGTEYKSGVSRMRIYYMFEAEREKGEWKAFNSQNAVVASGTFTGAKSGQPFDLLSIVPLTPMRRIEFTALDNGGRSPGSCPTGNPWPGGPQVSACVADNTDYGINNFDYFASCSGSEAVLFQSNKNMLLNAVNALQTDGPTRTDRGMAWAYYALSPKWRNMLPGSSSTIPRNYESNANRKIAILLSNAANYGGAADNTNTLEICKNMKNNGIEIFTISFGAPADAQAMLRSCASTDGNYYFDAPDQAALEEAFKDIARDISSLRLIE